MEKFIKIDGKEIKFISTASTLRRYRAKFQRDMLNDSEHVLNSARAGRFDPEDLEIFENMAYIMAKQADDSLPDTPDEWLDMFETFSIYDVLPELISLWNDSRMTLEEPKKNNGKPNEG